MLSNAGPAFDGSRELERILSDGLPQLYRMAFRYLDNSEDAEDAVQDALLLAFRHVSQFEGRSQFLTWVNRIVINSARMKLRTRPRYKAVSLDGEADFQEDVAPLADRLIAPGLSPEKLCEQAELHDMVNRMVGSLSPKLRAAYALCAIDGLSVQEAAQTLGINKRALKCRVVRARSRLFGLLRNSALRRAAAGPSAAKSKSLQRAQVACA